MTLGEKQRLFMECIGKLLMFVYERGWAVTAGDAYRSPKVFGMMGVQKGYGRPRSNHKIKLAMDLNLFKPNEDGKLEYCTDSEDHRELGEYWESLHPLCSWGGRFNDGNHYSLEHNGRR